MRVWEPFLTEQDREHLASLPPPPGVGFGRVPALVLIDNATASLGRERLPLLESIKKYPGSMGLPAWEAVDRTAELLELCRSNNVLVIHTTMLAGENSPYEFYSARRLSPATRTREGANAVNPTGETEVWDIVAELAPRHDEIVLRKLAPSAFHGTPLSSLLHLYGVDTLLVTGNSTSGCVRATVIDSASEMLRTIVVEECCYDRTEASHAINLFDMNQKYADVVPLAEVTRWIAASGPFGYASEAQPVGAT